MRISDWSSDVCSSDLVGRFLETLETEVPHLQKETARIVGLCAIGGVTVALLVVLLYGGLRGDWMAALLAGVATAMSLLPEELDWKSGGEGKRGSIRLITGGRRIIKKKKQHHKQ